MRTRHTTLLLAALLGAAVLLLSLQHGALRSGPAVAAGSGPEMALTVRDGGFCVANDCYAAVGENFELSVDVITAPAATYILFQSYIDFGGVYDPAASEDGAGPGSCSDGIPNGDRDGRDYYDADCTTVEIAYLPVASADLDLEIVWPDANGSLRLRGPFVHSSATHGAVSGFIPPIAGSSFTGQVLSLQMSCPATPAQATLALIPITNPFITNQGSVFADPDGVQTTPKLNSITMNCVAKSAGDTDGDGCSDATENGSDPVQGGYRDWLNPWDFYDVAGPGGPAVPDGVVDLPNDYMQVAAHYAPGGYPPNQGYEHYDRGLAGPGGSWVNTQPPDGVIDLPNDILGVIQQFQHSCA